jgi:hypothetical protein
VLPITAANVAGAVIVIWLIVIFVGRRREARVRIVSNPANPDEIDLTLSTAVAREFELFRDSGGYGLEVVEGVDQEVDIPAATLTPVAAGSSLAASLASLVRRTYRLEIRFESDDPSDLIAIARLFSPLGRLLASQVIQESAFGVLRPNAGMPLPKDPATRQTDIAKAAGKDDDNPASGAAGAGKPAATADVHVQLTLQPETAAPASDAGTEKPLVESSTPTQDDGAARKQRLGIAIGAWATYHLVLSRKSQASVLLTRDWKSYALFRFGVEWQKATSKEHARRAYREALEIDLFNTGALFNLGVIEAGRGCHAAALAMFQAARAETERVCRGVPGARSTNRLWYRTVYNIGAVHENARLKEQPPAGCAIENAQDQMPCARADIEDMVRKTARTIMAIERRRPSATWARNQSLVSFLRMIQSASVALLLVMSDDIPDRGRV